MMTETGTLDFSSSGTGEKKAGMIIGPNGRWQFTYKTDQVPLESSRRKLIYKGTFAGPAQQGSVAARALVFDASEVVAFGVECGNLGRLTDLGVGPKLFAVTQHYFETLGGSRPIIIEQDVGDSLASLLIGAGSYDLNPILHKPGTTERQMENKKILYDVFAQLQNAHEAGIYHCDLRCENVCVRRYGPEPTNIRATIIDFDLGATHASGEPKARASLYRTLFTEVPTWLAGKKATLQPNPLELDMAYLAALQYHLERNGLPLNGDGHPVEILADFTRYVDDCISYFGYRNGLSPYVRRIDTLSDIKDLAESIGLTPANAETFASPQLLDHAKSLHRPYLDAEDMEMCMRGPEALLTKMADDIVAAKFETYKALRRAQGKVVEYEHYDEQPIDLQRSNYAQAEHIPTKVRALGYLIVSEYDPEAYEEVTSFSDEQVEALARLEHVRWLEERISAGWTLSPERNHKNRTSPYLIPYDELPESMKEYDRDPARQLIGLVKGVGLMVVRPK